MLMANDAPRANASRTGPDAALSVTLAELCPSGRRGKDASPHGPCVCPGPSRDVIQQELLHHAREQQLRLLLVPITAVAVKTKQS